MNITMIFENADFVFAEKALLIAVKTEFAPWGCGIVTICQWISFWQTANSKQQTANSKQQTANSKQPTAKQLLLPGFHISKPV
ncbi:hypothetical protein [Alteromonas sp. H39]|uniref:hypothetical protein n=1 Tax=Alteromonas sp. H39 TaxID=3389876 RepID=UPI0039E0CDFF